MPISTGTTYTATLFTPGDIRAYPTTDIDRVQFPGTAALRSSGSNEIVITGTNAQITALETAITALDSDMGNRGLPVHFLIGTTRYTFWTNAVTFNAGKTEAVIDLQSPIDLPTATTSTAVSGGYFITEPGRIDSDGVSQSALPTDNRPVEVGGSKSEPIIIRVENEVVEREGTVYTIVFNAVNRVTNTSRIQIANPELELGFVYADDVSVQNGTTLWRAQVAEDDYLLATQPASPAAQSPVNTPVTSFNGFTQAEISGNTLIFTRPDGTKTTPLTLPAGTASLIAGITVDTATSELVITTQGGTITRLTVPVSESDDDFVDAEIAGSIITFVTRGGDRTNTITIPTRTNAEIDARADIRIRSSGNAATTSQRGNSALASNTETQAGSNIEKVVTPAGLRSAIITDGNIRDAIDARADARVVAGVQNWARDTTTAIPSSKLGNAPPSGLTQGQVDTRIQTYTGQTNSGAIIDANKLPNASTTQRGIGELATFAEAQSGSSDRIITADGLAAAMTNPGNIRTDVDNRVKSGDNAATTTARGNVELATALEATAGTDGTRVVTPAGLRSSIITNGNIRDAVDARANARITARVQNWALDTTTQIPLNKLGNAPSGGGGTTPANASTTTRGIVELATNAEAQTGTDTQRAVTPAGVEAWGNRTISFTQSGATVNRTIEQVFVSAVNRAIADGDLVI